MGKLRGITQVPYKRHLAPKLPPRMLGTKKGILTTLMKTPLIIVPEAGLEPARGLPPLDFESSASADSATPALFISILYRRVESIYRQSIQVF